MIHRREFITLLGCTAMWPLAARAQQPAMPVIGFLRSTPAAPFAHLLAALRQGLSDEGFVEGRNVAIEQRHADNQLEHLPVLATDLVRGNVSVIVGNVTAINAVRAATATIPIVFVTGADPVRSGLVASLNRPESNLTGVTFYGGSQLNTKQLELLRYLISKAAVFAVVGDTNYPEFEAGLPAVEAPKRPRAGWVDPIRPSALVPCLPARLVPPSRRRH